MCNSEKLKETYNPDVDPVKSYQDKCKVNYDFYNKVIATKENNERKTIYEDTIEPHTGNAFPLKAGQTIRFEQRPSEHNGRTQILDVQFVTPDLKQWSDHLNNGPIEGLNLKLYSGVWTQSQYMEKIATVVADEFPYELLDDKNTSHMFFAAHCCPEWIEMTHGKEANVNSCQENFIHGFNRIPAIQAIKDPEERKRVVQFYADKNDINIFQGNRFGQDENGITRCFLSPTPSVPDGTGVEFYAEKDCYVVVSNCPYADQALPFPEAKPNPVYISVEDTGIKPYSDNHLNINHGWEDKIYDRIFSKDVSPKEMID
ncbi:DUF1989 domain-containing protein [Flammeovirga sp. OC4]|uniref:DUF1989 domain-containing protein n=1 Tax=Flammeovirga sp. OC4 TaxID=1382345 RepID=UPI0005C67885|nr:DUF1989 domain-containing protein [Flammeovirga sp. OC4]